MQIYRIYYSIHSIKGSFTTYQDWFCSELGRDEEETMNFCVMFLLTMSTVFRENTAMSRLSVSSVLFFRTCIEIFPTLQFPFVFVLFFLEPLVTFLPSSYIPSHLQLPPFLICLHYRNSYLIELINMLGVHLERIK